MPEPRASALRVDRVSIVIPVYNSEGTIGALVDRCIAELAPRYASLQLVLVNDGSRDGSRCRSVAGRIRARNGDRNGDLGHRAGGCAGSGNGLRCGPNSVLRVHPGG